MQTIWSATLAKAAESPSVGAKSVPLVWQRERWETPDGDFIDVDSVEGQADQPHITLFHGLEGSSSSHYAQAFAACASQRGWSLSVPHFRGCSGTINRLPRAYHSGDSDEAAWVLNEFSRRRPTPRRYAIGVSLGGNVLMKWAGKTGNSAANQLQALAAIGAPLDLHSAGHAIGLGLNRWLYTPMFLRTMKRKAKEKWDQYPGLFALDRALGAKTIAEFDDAFTAPLHGFKNVDDYWCRASARPHLDAVKVPTLLVHAHNDPFVPWRSVSSREVSKSIELWQPKHGGHVGFLQMPHHPTMRGALWPWAQAVIDWLDKGEVTHG